MAQTTGEPQQDKRQDKKQAKARGKTRDNELAKAHLRTPTGFKEEEAAEIAAELNGVLADVFALYLKAKNFHWHLSGPHFRDYHLLFEEQAVELFRMVDPIAERVRRVGATTIRSIGQIAHLQKLEDNEADFVEAADMLAELIEDNQLLLSRLRDARECCEEHEDVGSTSLIEDWIDQTEKRIWFLYETSRPQLTSGH